MPANIDRQQFFCETATLTSGMGPLQSIRVFRGHRKLGRKCCRQDLPYPTAAAAEVATHAATSGNGNSHVRKRHKGVFHNNLSVLAPISAKAVLLCIAGGARTRYNHFHCLLPVFESRGTLVPFEMPTGTATTVYRPKNHRAYMYSPSTSLRIQFIDRYKLQ